MEMKKLLRLGMQFFAEGGSDGVDGTAASGNVDGTKSTEQIKQDTQGNDPAKDNNPDIEKLIQARADKITAESGKKIANLQKELEKMKRERMTAEEVKQLEMTEKEQALAEREKMLLDKENRLIAIKAIKEAGLDDGSENALDLVDFVMGENEEAIKSKVTAFGALVNKMVAAKVDRTFKQNGRNPNGGNGNGGDNEKETSVAEMLGKTRSEQQKRSREILDKYIK